MNLPALKCTSLTRAHAHTPFLGVLQHLSRPSSLALRLTSRSTSQGSKPTRSANGSKRLLPAKSASSPGYLARAIGRRDLYSQLRRHVLPLLPAERRRTCRAPFPRNSADTVLPLLPKSALQPESPNLTSAGIEEAHQGKPICAKTSSPTFKAGKLTRQPPCRYVKGTRRPQRRRHPTSPRHRGRFRRSLRRENRLAW